MFEEYNLPRRMVNQKNRRLFFYLRFIRINNLITELYTKPLKSWFRVDLGPSQARWGIEGFILTWAILFISLFCTIRFSSTFQEGGKLEWVFLGLGIACILLFLNLSFYFLAHQNKDPSLDQLNRIERKIDRICT